MRIGRYLKYGSKFWDGREQIYIEKGFSIGAFRIFNRVVLEVNEAEGVANLIKANLEDNR